MNSIRLPLPDKWRDAEALLLTAIDPTDNEIYTWSWKIQNSESLIKPIVNLNSGSRIEVDERDSPLVLNIKDTSFTFSKQMNLLTSIHIKNSKK